MPSRWEGLSSAALQAMAAGVPCVFSDIPSFRTQFPDSVVQFHAVESVPELETALFEVLCNKGGLGEQEDEFVAKTYSLKRMAEEYERLYMNCV